MPPRPRRRTTTPNDTTAGLARAIALLDRFSQRVAATFGRMATIANIVSAAYARISAAATKIAASLQSSVASLKQISAIMANQGQNKSTGAKVATGAAVGAAEGAAAFASSQGLTQAFARLSGASAATATSTAATTAALSAAAAPAATTAVSFASISSAVGSVTAALSAAVPYVAAIAAAGAAIYASWKVLEPIWPAIATAIGYAGAALSTVVTWTTAIVNPLTYVRAGWNLAVKSAYALRDAAYAVASAVRSAVVGAVNAAIAAWRTLSEAAVATAAKIVGGLQAIGRGAATIGSSLSRGLATAWDALDKLLQKVAYVGVAIAGLGASVVAPLTEAANKFGEAGAELEKLADKTGLTVQQMAELGYAAEKSDGSVKEFAAGLQKSTELLADAIDGGKKASESFRRLKVDAESLETATREEQFYAIATAVASIEDPLDRAATAQEFFGAAGESVLKMLDGGIGGLAAMRDEANKLGRTMDGDAAASATALTRSYAALKAGLQGLWQTIGQAVAPAITDWNKLLTGAVQGAVAWAKANQPLIASVFRVAEGAVTVGTALAAAAAGIVPLLPKLMLAAGAAAAGAIAWVNYGRSVEAAVAPFRAGLAKLWEEATRVFAGISNAVRAGNLELAVEILWSGVQAAWVRGLTALASITGDSLGGIVRALAAGDWSSAGNQAMSHLKIAFEAGLGELDAMGTSLRNLFDSLLTHIQTTWDSIASRVTAEVRRLQGLIAGVASYDPTGAAIKVSNRIDTAINKAISGELQSAAAAKFQQLATVAAKSAGDLARKVAEGTATEADRSAASQAASAAQAAGEGLSEREREMARRNAQAVADLENRQAQRREELAKRQTDRDARIAELRGDAARQGDAAGSAAQEKIAALEKRLNEQLAAAEAARAAAEANAGDQFARDRERLAKATSSETKTGYSATSTFSATAAALLGPRSTLDRIARATEKVAKNTQPKQLREGRFEPVFIE